MRVLIASANQEQNPDPVLPLGAAIAAGAARAAGHEVRLQDACFAGPTWPDQVAEACRAWEPEVVGLSLRNLDDVAWPRVRTWLPWYREVAARLRAAAPRARLVLGGAAVTLLPEALRRALEADHALAGEAEERFPALLAELAAGRTPPPVLDAPHLDLARTAVEPAWDLVDLPRYLREGGAVNLQSKRGCGFRCAFCSYPLLEGGRIRVRPAAATVDGIEHLVRQHGVDSLFVVDSTFNQPRQAALEFCAALRQRGLPLRWTAYCTPSGFDPGMAQAMRDAGCASVEFGSDSLHPDTLAGLGKSFSPEDVAAAAAAARAAGLRHCHSLILGGPGETEATLRISLERLAACRPDAAVLMLGVRIYPRTALARRAAAEGLLQEDEIGLEPVFYLADAVRGRLEELAREAVIAHPNWVAPGLEDAGARGRVRARARRRGVRGPLWELLPPPPG